MFFEDKKHKEKMVSEEKDGSRSQDSLNSLASQLSPGTIRFRAVESENISRLGEDKQLVIFTWQKVLDKMC